MSQGSSEIPDEVLGQIDSALRKCYLAALTLAPALAEPYPDDPRWTPYTRFLEPAGRAAHDARQALTRALLLSRDRGSEENSQS